MARLSKYHVTCFQGFPAGIFILALLSILLVLFLDPVRGDETAYPKASAAGPEAVSGGMNEAEVRAIIGEDLLKQLDNESQKYAESELERIRLEREALEALRSELDERINRMEQLRNEIDQRLSVEEEQEEERIQKLVKVVEGMKPDQISKLLWELNEDIRYQVLGRLNKKTISKILALLPPKKAAEAARKMLQTKED